MSMSRGCKLIEVAPDEWWCAVAHDEHDYDIETGVKYGPAPTAEEAFRMIRVSNPGMSETVPYAELTEDDLALLDRMSIG